MSSSMKDLLMLLFNLNNVSTREYHKINFLNALPTSQIVYEKTFILYQFNCIELQDVSILSSKVDTVSFLSCELQ